MRHFLDKNFGQKPFLVTRHSTQHHIDVVVDSGLLPQGMLICHLSQNKTGKAL